MTVRTNTLLMDCASLRELHLQDVEDVSCTNDGDPNVTLALTHNRTLHLYYADGYRRRFNEAVVTLVDNAGSPSTHIGYFRGTLRDVVAQVVRKLQPQPGSSPSPIPMGSPADSATFSAATNSTGGDITKDSSSNSGSSSHDTNANDDDNNGNNDNIRDEEESDFVAAGCCQSLSSNWTFSDSADEPPGAANMTAASYLQGTELGCEIALAAGAAATGQCPILAIESNLYSCESVQVTFSVDFADIFDGDSQTARARGFDRRPGLDDITGGRDRSFALSVTLRFEGRQGFRSLSAPTVVSAEPAAGRFAKQQLAILQRYLKDNWLPLDSKAATGECGFAPAHFAGANARKQGVLRSRLAEETCLSGHVRRELQNQLADLQFKSNSQAHRGAREGGVFGQLAMYMRSRAEPRNKMENFCARCDDHFRDGRAEEESPLCPRCCSIAHVLRDVFAVQPARRIFSRIVYLHRIMDFAVGGWEDFLRFAGVSRTFRTTAYDYHDSVFVVLARFAVLPRRVTSALSDRPTLFNNLKSELVSRDPRLTASSAVPDIFLSRASKEAHSARLTVIACMQGINYYSMLPPNEQHEELDQQLLFEGSRSNVDTMARHSFFLRLVLQQLNATAGHDPAAAVSNATLCKWLAAAHSARFSHTRILWFLKELSRDVLARAVPCSMLTNNDVDNEIPAIWRVLSLASVRRDSQNRSNRAPRQFVNSRTLLRAIVSGDTSLPAAAIDRTLFERVVTRANGDTTTFVFDLLDQDEKAISADFLGGSAVRNPDPGAARAMRNSHLQSRFEDFVNVLYVVSSALSVTSLRNMLTHPRVINISNNNINNRETVAERVQQVYSPWESHPTFDCSLGGLFNAVIRIALRELMMDEELARSSVSNLCVREFQLTIWKFQLKIEELQQA